VDGARTLAASLPREDPVRAYVHDDLGALIEGAGSSDASDLAVLLALRAVVEHGTQAQRKALSSRLPAWATREPLAWTLRGMDEWGTSQDYAALHRALLAMRELAGRPTTAPSQDALDLASLLAALGIPIGRVPDEIESLATVIRTSPSSAWLALDTLAAHHVSLAYGALDQILGFHRDTRGATTEAQFVADLLGGLEEPANPFQRYARHLVKAEQRTLALDQLVKDLQELTMFGGTALWRLYGTVGHQCSHARAGPRQVTRAAERRG
jgi:hypothetical protein